MTGIIEISLITAIFLSLFLLILVLWLDNKEKGDDK